MVTNRQESKLKEKKDQLENISPPSYEDENYERNLIHAY
jgi:hypothetical protein